MDQAGPETKKMFRECREMSEGHRRMQERLPYYRQS
jgi:hypothetical protein